jgi:hypothetical protein
MKELRGIIPRFSIARGEYLYRLPMWGALTAPQIIASPIDGVVLYPLRPFGLCYHPEGLPYYPSVPHL